MTEADGQTNNEDIGICHVCGETFPTQVEMSKHLMDAHEDDALPTPGLSEPEE